MEVLTQEDHGLCGGTPNHGHGHEFKMEHLPFWPHGPLREGYPECGEILGTNWWKPLPICYTTHYIEDTGDLQITLIFSSGI